MNNTLQLLNEHLRTIKRGLQNVPSGTLEST